MRNKNLYIVQTYLRTGDMKYKPLGKQIVYLDDNGCYRYCIDGSKVNFNLIPDENQIIASEPVICSYGQSKKRKKPR